MQYRDINRYCDKQVKRLEREVGLPDPFVLDAFVRRFAAWRGRPIHLLPYDHVPGGMNGMWLGLASFDVIAYSRSTPLHEEHIILHEIGHMLCGHRGGDDVRGDVIRLLMPDLDPAMVRRVLGRTSYPDTEEQEAEFIATLILKKVADRRPRSVSTSTPELDPELDRLKSTFEG